VPPLLPTTSTVAVAAARILAAYLANHRLSPVEAVSLGGVIAETLAGLATEGDLTSSTARAPTAQPATRQPPGHRAEPQEPAAWEAGVPEAELVTARELEWEAEPEAEAMPDVDDSPQPAPEPGRAPQPDAPIEAAGSEVLPGKRKRPSRPRSRRGKGSASAGAGKSSGDEPDGDGEPPEIELLSARAEIEVAPGLGGAGLAPEGAEDTPKPRRTPSRARRVATP
jgi:hypothetical protein